MSSSVSILGACAHRSCVQDNVRAASAMLRPNTALCMASALLHRAGLYRPIARPLVPTCRRARASLLNQAAIAGDQASHRLPPHALGLLVSRDRLSFPAVDLACVRNAFPIHLPMHVGPSVRIRKKTRMDLLMCKFGLRKSQMAQAAVNRAKSFADDLLRWEVRGPGDTANAMRRIATRSSLPFAKLWALRYRPPKEIGAHVLACIEAAHAAEMRRQLRKLAHDIEVTACIAGPSHPAVRAGAAVLRAVQGNPEGASSVLATTDLGSDRRSHRERAEGLNDLPLWRAPNVGE